MKPLNFDNSPCSPTASDCVIWSGPDLVCINLCKGDNITDVVAKLATELCGILDILNISAYDISCFNLANCAPQTFTDLINFLIVKVCELDNGTPSGGGTTPSGGCPTDCFVEVAPCFRVGSATTMNLTTYVTTIGNRICDIANTISLQQIAINNLGSRVTVLENAVPPSYTTPTMVMGCIVGSLGSGTTQGIDTVIRTFINDVWCSYVFTTGNTGCLATAVANQTVLPSDFSKVNPSVAMSVQYTGLWVTPATKICDTINNIWACIKDLRNAPTVRSVTGLNTDNADPLNPIVKISVDGTTITGLGTPASPLVALISKGDVSISKLLSGDLTVTLTNITGPVTYQWSFADANPGLLFTSATNIATVTLIRNSNTLQYQPFTINVTGTTAMSTDRYTALVKVRVINSNGFIYTDHYNHSIDISLIE